MQFDNHDLVTLSEAARLVPGSRHPSTIWRWINEGRCGVCLESLEIGGVTYTSRSAIQRFCDEVTAAKKRLRATSDI